MTKLHKSLFILALAIPLASANLSWAAMNTKPTPGSGTGEGEATCLKWCQDNNKTSGRVSKCAVQCEVYWCRNGKCGLQDEPATATGAKPGGGTSAGPTNPLPPKEPPPGKAR